MPTNFIERTLRGLLKTSEYESSNAMLAASGGALQSIDPRFSVAGIFLLIVVAVAAHNLTTVSLLLILAICLGWASRVSLIRSLQRVWLPVLFFTGLVAAPSVFTLHAWRPAVLILLRALTAASLASLLVFTIPWPRLLHTLRTLGCPAIVVAILGMTARYIFLMLRTATDMMESRRSRTVGRLSSSDSRRLAAASAGVLLGRSIHLAEEVHAAMLSRGYRGEIRLLSQSSNP